MEEEIKIFDEYVGNFDLKDEGILRKKEHSYRVMNFAKSIAESLKLNEADIYIATLAGLVHDIGRFNQLKFYGTFKDSESIDHGDEGYRVLCDFIDNFTTDKEIQNIVLLATKYHNKFKIGNVDDRTKMFCKIVRDADKLDIIETQINEVNSENIVIKDELLKSIYKKEICKNDYCETEEDAVLRMISWIFDLNFAYSYKYLKDNKIIERKFNVLKRTQDKQKLAELEEFVYREIEEMNLC